MPASFRIYVDESGDEGFVFRPDGSGSSRWLILGAVIVRHENDRDCVRCLDVVRQVLRRKPRQPLHFTDMRHEHRLPYVREIKKTACRLAAVLIHKPSIQEPEKFAVGRHQLYRYASRLLLERVSWCCRDHCKPGVGDGSAEVVFSNRAQMSYDELRDYLRHLKANADALQVRIDWSVIDPDRIEAKPHGDLAGLQMADAVSSGLKYAVLPNEFSDTETRYTEPLRQVFYRHKQTLLGYGLKFWPVNTTGLVADQPHLKFFETL
jgi:hypothetical protein